MTTANIPVTTTSPTENAVLVLSTETSTNKLMIVDFEGEIWFEILISRYSFPLGNINENLAFEYGDGTEARSGCGVTFQNEFWYFGGYTYKRQVFLTFERLIMY